MIPQSPDNRLIQMQDGQVQAREQIQELQSREHKLRVQAPWIKVQRSHLCIAKATFIFKVLIQALRKLPLLSWLRANGRNPKKSFAKSYVFQVSNYLWVFGLYEGLGVENKLILSTHRMIQAEKILGKIIIKPIFGHPTENESQGNVQNMSGQINLIFSDRMTHPKNQQR